MKGIKKKGFDLKNLLYAGWFGISNPWGSDSFSTTGGFIGKVTDVLNFAVAASGLVGVILLVYGGYTMIMAAGDSDKIEQGQQIVQATIIGLVIVFVARLGIVFVIEKVLGL